MDGRVLGGAIGGTVGGVVGVSLIVVAIIVWYIKKVNRVSSRYLDTTNRQALVHGKISHANNWLYYGNEG